MSHLSVSVVITTYNRANLVARAINSVLVGCSRDDEIIVVDDGSSDDTESVIRSEFGDRVRYLKLENGGQSRARNHGVRMATRDLIAFLDDDDEWIPEKIALQRKLMEARPDVLFCFSNFRSRFVNGKVVESCVFNWDQRVKSWPDVTGSEGVLCSSLMELPEGFRDFNVFVGDIYFHQMLDDYVLPTTLMVRRVSGFELAAFVEDMRFLESWAYSSRLAKHGLAAYMDCDMACQHDHGGPRVTNANQLTQMSTRLRILERQWGGDEEFLKLHGESYKKRLDEDRILYVRELIANAQSAQAREQIKMLHSPAPLLLRILSCFPSVVLRVVFGLREEFKKRLVADGQSAQMEV